MTILAVVVWIIILGFVAYIVRAYAPIPEGFKKLIYAVLIVIAVLIALQAFGLLGVLDATVPKLR